MEKRTSSIQHVKLVTLSTSAVFEIGDSKEISPVSKAIAIQRERAIFLVDELHFQDFNIFSMPIPQPLAYESVDMVQINESPHIQVGSIELFSVSSSSVVHLGSSESIQTDSRIKHIRHLFERKQKIPLRGAE